MQILLYDAIGFLVPAYPVCAGLLAITILPLCMAVPTPTLPKSPAGGSHDEPVPARP
jgi:hypothetical protein